jgi:hypothetical protein
MFTTYLEKQVNAIGYSGFRDTEVLLDNQADISIMRPELLRALQPTEKKIQVNGVGGLQLTVDRKGYLDDFFDVYASEHMKANVLSFSEAEDAYDITYVPREASLDGLRENCKSELIQIGIESMQRYRTWYPKPFFFNFSCCCMHDAALENRASTRSRAEVSPYSGAAICVQDSLSSKSPPPHSLLTAAGTHLRAAT